MNKKNRQSKEKPLVHYDSMADVLYVATRGGREDNFMEIAPGINIELNRQKEVIGIEILNASRFLKPVLKPLEKRLISSVAVAI